MSSNRRSFLSATTLGAASLLAHRAAGQTQTTTLQNSNKLDSQSLSRNAAEHPLIVFAKPLEHFEFDELGKRLRSIGVQGIEATLRKGGQISPPNFEKELGKLTEALAKYDQRVIVAASDINEASTDSERQLRQFAKHGIPNIRMNYYRYDFTKPILPQLDAFAKQAAELAALCKATQVRALYQNHAGKNYMGSALWDLQQVLRAIDPTHLAVALDLRHTVLELSQSWQSACSVIRPHVGAIYIKDVAWVDNKPQNVPLGEGIVRPVFEAINKEGLVGPLSLHVEYFDHTDPRLQEQRWQAVVKDVARIKQWQA